MKRAAPLWLAFFASLATLLAVMLFFTIRMLQFERAEAKAQANAALEETIRLALWRMDSAAALLVAPPSGSKLLSANDAPPLAQNAQVQQRFDESYQGQISRQEFQQRGNLNRMPIPNWRSIEPELLDRIKDILPGATLEPASDSSPDDTRRLASIPARLVVPPSAIPAAAVPAITPLRISLLIAWCCALLAAAAVGYLLSATLSLSERRANFASAVTHELRTPLTTFRMYAEMLAAGMIDDPARRAQYLDTLVTESDRLGHLIENVLAYSRLENKLSPRQQPPITVDALLNQSLPALQRRVAQAGAALNVSIPPELAARTIHTDPVAVQQILINLVDNACKFARTDIALAISLDDEAHRLSIAITDRGPGLSSGAKPFTAFGKSRSDPIPGIGLGLFLSAQLARDIGGDLSHSPAAPGTGGVTFVLSLPL
jgi:signal transduction histidine kinase